MMPTGLLGPGGMPPPFSPLRSLQGRTQAPHAKSKFLAIQPAESGSGLQLVSSFSGAAHPALEPVVFGIVALQTILQQLHDRCVIMTSDET